jgi:hypothetical protein
LLETLSDEEYCNVFSTLAGISFRIPDPQALIQEIKVVAKYLTSLVQHVIFWVNPTWKFPKNNQVDLRANLSLVRVLQQCYKPVDGNEDDILFASLDEIEARTAKIAQSERTVVRALSQIQAYIHRNKQLWKTVPAVSPILSFLNNCSRTNKLPADTATADVESAQQLHRGHPLSRATSCLSRPVCLPTVGRSPYPCHPLAHHRAIHRRDEALDPQSDDARKYLERGFNPRLMLSGYSPLTGQEDHGGANARPNC